MPQGRDTDKGDEPNTRLIIEQALSAALDSILKAQLHSARSFLNLLLQLGYPDQGESSDVKDGHPYSLDFQFTKDGETQKLLVPAFALVPISPLAIDSANFQREMSARRIVKQAQMRESVQHKDATGESKDVNRYQRPGLRVDRLVNIKGDLVAGSNAKGDHQRESQSAIKFNINLKSVPLPAGLDKLLSSIGNMAEISNVEPKPKVPQIDDPKDQKFKNSVRSAKVKLYPQDFFFDNKMVNFCG